MTAVGVLLCAAALLAVPGPQARLRSLRTPPVIAVRYRAAIVPVSAVVGAVTLVWFAGVHALFAAVIVGATGWKRRRSATEKRKFRTESARLIAALDTVIGELGVGSHPASASAVAAAESSGTVGIAFERASGHARMGGRAHDGLSVPDAAISGPLSIVASAWRIADDHGLALARLLGAARRDMQVRNRFRDRTQASLAGARATGTVLACLPIVGVGLGQAMGASPLSVLLGGGLGGILLVIGTALVCGGLLWTDAITDKVCR
ncbi:type ii secretion system integral membrane subunit [Rhodococcus sp. 06-156-3C]|uniref:type II secretion system F family protein n=1 Tax=Nocardiaceae TaxID=85025 RepID=UPI000522FB09|nr:MULTISPECIES: type ii secretion system integral membrane subunit [Rhodococcus]OZD14922.1 type ii secretion system integral membrane subunit [Rhodococcus sp. 06-156-4C]OZD19997.1 type ii secretion system integral membrane subunit [Rhodococcus sp. 06-156-4a]OZD22696.1 type ii secretion system integral membrane subunit [Rhodococcus sp. 06-156-3C]OZD26014.1 type ii secretion system integral membrane subunit [Rhodococcus sp. 06-156-3b]OZD38223.1 type ii secretion system integral membrane subunit